MNPIVVAIFWLIGMINIKLYGEENGKQVVKDLSYITTSLSLGGLLVYLAYNIYYLIF